jgi:hypothetical protein
MVQRVRLVTTFYHTRGLLFSSHGSALRANGRVMPLWYLQEAPIQEAFRWSARRSALGGAVFERDSAAAGTAFRYGRQPQALEQAGRSDRLREAPSAIGARGTFTGPRIAVIAQRFAGVSDAATKPNPPDGGVWATPSEWRVQPASLWWQHHYWNER